MRSGLRAAAPLLTHPRFEVIPTDSIEGTVVEKLPRDVTVTVTTSAAKGPRCDRGPCRALGKAGLHGRAAHLGAFRQGRGAPCRYRRSPERLRDRGCLRPGGRCVILRSAASTAPCRSSRRLDALGRPFPCVGITGYPESHPEIPDDVTIQAMWDKRHYATYIVSNLCFDARTVKRWINASRARCRYCRCTGDWRDRSTARGC